MLLTKRMGAPQGLLVQRDHAAGTARIHRRRAAVYARPCFLRALRRRTKKMPSTPTRTADTANIKFLPKSAVASAVPEPRDVPKGCRVRTFGHMSGQERC